MFIMLHTGIESSSPETITSDECLFILFLISCNTLLNRFMDSIRFVIKCIFSVFPIFPLDGVRKGYLILEKKVYKNFAQI